MISAMMTKLKTIISYEELKDTKGAITIHKSKDRQQNGQKDKQRSTKHYTEN